MQVRFTRFCGGPKHSDSPINCSHAPGLTEPSEESPIAGWPQYSSKREMVWTPDGRPQGPTHHIPSPLAPTIRRIGPPSPCIVGAGVERMWGRGPRGRPSGVHYHARSTYLNRIGVGPCYSEALPRRKPRESAIERICRRATGISLSGTRRGMALLEEMLALLRLMRLNCSFSRG
jgi:hypothetical protein